VLAHTHTHTHTPSTLATVFADGVRLNRSSLEEGSVRWWVEGRKYIAGTGQTTGVTVQGKGAGGRCTPFDPPHSTTQPQTYVDKMASSFPRYFL